MASTKRKGSAQNGPKNKQLKLTMAAAATSTASAQPATTVKPNRRVTVEESVDVDEEEAVEGTGTPAPDVPPTQGTREESAKDQLGKYSLQQSSNTLTDCNIVHLSSSSGQLDGRNIRVL